MSRLISKHREKELAKRRFRVETKKRLARLPFTLAEESVIYKNRR